MADCGLPQLLIGQAIIPVIGCIRIGVIGRPELVIGKCLIRSLLLALSTGHRNRQNTTSTNGVDWHQYGASSFALNGATILAANGTTPFAPNRST